jgi:O-antigen ligase
MQISIPSNPHFTQSPIVFLGGERFQATHEVHVVGPVVRWTLYAFVFSLLFEEAPIGFRVELTAITGALLAGAALLIQPHICFRKAPAAFWCFVVYFCVGTATLAFHEALSDQDVVFRQLKFLQLIILFWLAYNLMRDERAARGALLSLIAACVVLSFLESFGLITTTEKALSKSGRMSAYGLSPANVAGLLSLGVLALIGLAYSSKRSTFQRRLFIWPLVALIGLAVVEAGSRGPLLALGAGLLVFVLNRGTVLTKLRNAFVVLLGIGFFFWVTYNSETTRPRFEATFESGHMTDRDRIYPLAWQMFLEKPLAGWGPVANTVELGNRVNAGPRYERMDAHNLILYVLTATGILGAIPFFAGTWLCLRSAWKARGGAEGILPLAMAVSILTAAMSSSGFHWKQHWLVLAYALASGYQFVIRLERPGSPPELRSFSQNTAK